MKSLGVKGDGRWGTQSRRRAVSRRQNEERWAESKGKEKSRARGGEHKHSNYTAYISRQFNELYSNE
jgi:hypothetical protein